MLEAAVSDAASECESSEDDGSYESDFVVSDGSSMSEEVPCGARLGYNVRIRGK